MNTYLNFAVAALPWIAIGMMLAVTFARQDAKRNGKPMTPMMNKLAQGTVICFLVVAVLEYMAGKNNTGTLWVVLGICNAVLQFGGQK